MLHNCSLIIAGEENQWFVAAVDDRIVSVSELLLILLCRNVGIGTEDENFFVFNAIINEIKSFDICVGVGLLLQNWSDKKIVGLINVNRLIFFQVKFVEVDVVNEVSSCGKRQPVLCRLLSFTDYAFVVVAWILKSFKRWTDLVVQSQHKVLNYNVTKNEFGAWVDIKFFLKLLFFFKYISDEVRIVAKEGANFVLGYQTVQMV